MNRDRIVKLIQVLSTAEHAPKDYYWNGETRNGCIGLTKKPKFFDMRSYNRVAREHSSSPSCGTVACIGGYTVHLALNDPEFAETTAQRDEIRRNKSVYETAKDYLGLNNEQARALFVYGAWGDVTPQHAVYVLNCMLAAVSEPTHDHIVRYKKEAERAYDRFFGHVA